MSETDVSGGSTTIEHDGFTIQSTDSAESMRNAFAQEPAEERPKDGKINADEVRSVQDGGKTRDGAGRFAGTVKPIKDAKPNGEDKAAGTKPGESAVQKDAKAQQPKQDDKPDADEIAQVKADEEEKASQRRNEAALRVQQATQRAAQERRERVARDAEIARLRAELEAAKSPSVPRETQPAKPRQVDGPPDPETFQGTMQEYLDARDKWNREQIVKELRAEQEQLRANQEREQTIQKVRKLESEFREGVQEMPIDDLPALPDILGYDDAGEPKSLADLWPTYSVPPDQVGPDNLLADEIIAAGKHGPRLMRYLSEHPDDLRRIVTAPNPAAFTRAMGRVEAKLEAAITAKPAKPPFQPGAFKPVPAVTGKPHAADDDADMAGLDFDSYVSKRMRQGRR